MKLLLKNRKQFIDNLLDPISNLNTTGTVKIEKEAISSLTSSSDSTLILYARIVTETDAVMNLNLPDIKKLIRVMDCIHDDQVEFTVANNNIQYISSDFKFKYHLLEDNIIKAPAINVEKLGKLTFDKVFQIPTGNLNKLFKGASFATETTKMYLYCEDGTFMGELGDKARHNSDNFVVKLCDAAEMFTEVLPINFETFRLINFNKFEDISISINTKLSIVQVKLVKDNVTLIYIISALIK